MRILITGGAGFQGTHLATRLLCLGYRVSIFNSLSKTAQKNLTRLSPFIRNQHLKVVWGSVTDKESVDKIVREQDAVFHLAANIHVDESRSNPLGYLDTNVLGTFNVLEACKVGAIPLIYISSCEVYGGTKTGLLTEESPFKPRSPYAASKAAADCLAQSYATTYGMPITILRPANVFGPYQRGGVRGALIPKFVDKALSGKPFTIYGTGEQSRSFIHVTNLISAYEFVLKRAMSPQAYPQVFNVSSGEEVSVLEVGRIISNTLSRPYNPVFLPARPGEVSSFFLSAKKLEDLGWSTACSFEDSLISYIEQKQDPGAPYE